MKGFDDNKKSWGHFVKILKAQVWISHSTNNIYWVDHLSNFLGSFQNYALEALIYLIKFLIKGYVVKKERYCRSLFSIKLSWLL